LVSNAGNATGVSLSGSTNADTLLGGDGADSLSGGAGDDSLRRFGVNRDESREKGRDDDKSLPHDDY
jgi:Ca2+-binding RTX toxin-like protein